MVLLQGQAKDIFMVLGSTFVSMSDMCDLLVTSEGRMNPYCQYALKGSELDQSGCFGFTSFTLLALSFIELRLRFMITVEG